jgi:hypothetical protein
MVTIKTRASTDHNTPPSPSNKLRIKYMGEWAKEEIILLPGNTVQYFLNFVKNSSISVTNLLFSKNRNLRTRIKARIKMKVSNPIKE